MGIDLKGNKSTLHRCSNIAESSGEKSIQPIKKKTKKENESTVKKGKISTRKDSSDDDNYDVNLDMDDLKDGIAQRVKKSATFHLELWVVKPDDSAVAAMGNLCLVDKNNSDNNFFKARYIMPALQLYVNKLNKPSSDLIIASIGQCFYLPVQKVSHGKNEANITKRGDAKFIQETLCFLIRKDIYSSFDYQFKKLTKVLPKIL